MKLCDNKKKNKVNLIPQKTQNPIGGIVWKIPSKKITNMTTKQNKSNLN